MPTLKLGADLQAAIKKIVLDTYFPVGSLKLTATPTNPGTELGGTWVQIKNRFLFATNATSGNKGKDAVSSHTGTNVTGTAITKAQLPNYTLYSASHGHSVKRTVFVNDQNIKEMTGMSEGWGFSPQGVGRTGDIVNGTTITVSSGGSGNTHNHGVSYTEVYVWQRTA